MTKLRVAVVGIAAAAALTLTSSGSMACDGLKGMAPAPKVPSSIKDLVRRNDVPADDPLQRLLQRRFRPEVLA